MRTTFVNSLLYFGLAASLAFQVSCTTDNIDFEEVIVDDDHDYGTIDDLMSLSEGSTAATSGNPMGKYYENLQIATAIQKSWLEDAAAEPAMPSGREQSLVLLEKNVQLFPFGKPSPADCNQRALGDCSAIAIFASLAYINPDYVASLITDNGDDTYTVDMFDPKATPIKVSVSNKFMSHSDSQNMAAVAGKSGDATWATIFEKALMKYIEVYNLVGTIEGIGSEFASPAFTGAGDSFAFYPTKLDPTQMKRAVEVSLAEGKLVIGGFNQADVQVGQSKTVTAHAWSFSYTPQNQVNGYQPLFVMRNPWGGDNGSDLDGQMFIPNDQSITNLIDLRIIDAGAAATTTIPGVYTPPNY